MQIVTQELFYFPAMQMANDIQYINHLLVICCMLKLCAII